MGLQRERGDRRIAGIRTFPLITMLGVLAALADRHMSAGGWWITASAFLGVCLLTIGGELLAQLRGSGEPGLTTDIAILIMFVVGVLLAQEQMEIAVVASGATVLLLHLKQPLHAFVRGLEERDVRAMMQFALITLVVLPILPDRTMGPFNVFNPYHTWLMVVLVVGISLAGYVAYKLLGTVRGTLVAGLLGGAISSTATTASYARSVRGAPHGPVSTAALGIMLASMVSLVRVLIELRVVAGVHFYDMAAPIGAMFLTLFLLAIALWAVARRDSAELPPPENPTELKSALIFGALFAGVLIASAAAKTHLGERGIYAVAVVSGLTDMDAITLSTGRLVSAGEVLPATGWRAVLIAAMANLCFKAGIVGVIGSRRLFGAVAALYAIPLATGIGLLLFWPSR